MGNLKYITDFILAHKKKVLLFSMLGLLLSIWVCISIYLYTTTVDIPPVSDARGDTAEEHVLFTGEYNQDQDMNLKKVSSTISSFFIKSEPGEVSLVGIEDWIQIAWMNKETTYLTLVKERSAYENKRCSIAQVSITDDSVEARKCAAWAMVATKYAETFALLADMPVKEEKDSRFGSGPSSFDISIRMADEYIKQAVSFEDLAFLRMIQKKAERELDLCARANGPQSFFKDCGAWGRVLVKVKDILSSFESQTPTQETKIEVSPMPVNLNDLNILSPEETEKILDTAIKNKNSALVELIKQRAEIKNKQFLSRTPSPEVRDTFFKTRPIWGRIEEKAIEALLTIESTQVESRAPVSVPGSLGDFDISLSSIVGNIEKAVAENNLAFLEAAKKQAVYEQEMCAIETPAPEFRDDYYENCSQWAKVVSKLANPKALLSQRTYYIDDELVSEEGYSLLKETLYSDGEPEYSDELYGEGGSKHAVKDEVGNKYIKTEIFDGNAYIYNISRF